MRVFPPDEQFLDALGRIRGPIAGVSVGVDRLLMALFGKERIGQVLQDRLTLEA
jgi:elongation factor P--beta-lysine ligase